jgi:DNA repair protein RadA/Sms
MAKTRTQYVCQNCGSAQPKWAGRCPDCGEWNTLVETVVAEPPKGATPRLALVPTSTAQPLPAIAADGFARIPLPLPELSRVLGGGIVPGSVVLIGGDPGIGKSTLLLQMASWLARAGGPILYVSGEESAQQIRLRADRLGIADANLYVLAEVNLEQILAHMERLRPRLTIVDSIQSVYTEELTGAAGSVGQVRECAAQLLRFAKANHSPVFLVGHVTKTGAIAGPRVLEHIVDAVLYLEGERFQSYRLLRSVKNRFGSTNEVGVFEMTEEGLREVANPSEAFLAERLPNAAGSAIAITMEGTRPLLVEIQALSSTTSFAIPRRTGNGVDFNRLLLLVAVLSKRLGLRLSDQDIFVNVVGGLKVSEPAADLAIALAIASSFKNVPVSADLAIVGEIGLSGELRTVSHLGKRLSEAARLGFKRCLIPRGATRQVQGPDGLQLIGARSLDEALEAALLR